MNEEQIINVLIEKYQIEQNQFTIRGAGMGGKLMCDISRGEKFVPSFIVDSNSKCWNTCINGIAVVQPERLENFKGYVFIVVKFHSWEIAERIEKINNLLIVSIYIIID